MPLPESIIGHGKGSLLGQSRTFQKLMVGFGSPEETVLGGGEGVDLNKISFLEMGEEKVGT